LGSGLSAFNLLVLLTEFSTFLRENEFSSLCA
jgi:hypothetical protein